MRLAEDTGNKISQGWVLDVGMHLRYFELETSIRKALLKIGEDFETSELFYWTTWED